MFTPQKASSLEWLPLNIDVDFLHLNLQKHCAEMRGQWRCGISGINVQTAFLQAKMHRKKLTKPIKIPPFVSLAD